MKQKYKETQQFNDKLVFLLLGAGFIGTLFGMIQALFLQPANWNIALVYLLSAALISGTFWYLRQLKLTISVDDQRIKFKFFPFQKRPKRIEWNQVDACSLVRSPRSAQWHGGNIHFSGERWYSLIGRNGLSIETKDGRRYFIGCRNLDKLNRLLHRKGLTSS